MWLPVVFVTRVRISKRLRSPGSDSKESVPPACVAWRAGTNRYLGSLKVYKFGLCILSIKMQPYLIVAVETILTCPNYLQYM
jgi:hypothetical protein